MADPSAEARFPRIFPSPQRLQSTFTTLELDTNHKRSYLIRRKERDRNESVSNVSFPPAQVDFVLLRIASDHIMVARTAYLHPALPTEPHAEEKTHITYV
jgi:hypothetical protein